MPDQSQKLQGHPLRPHLLNECHLLNDHMYLALHVYCSQEMRCFQYHN